MTRLRHALLLGLWSGLCLAPLQAQDFRKQVIYQIVTDRFFDGDPANNDPPQSRGLYDPTHTNWWMYWGGDFAGIEQRMAYLTAMGVTAIWISPVADNINLPIKGFGGNTWTGYHGYWTRDFKRLEEHFGDAQNSWKEFDSLVGAAHRHHLKVIADFAPNHSNPDDVAEYGALYDDGKLLGKPADDPQSYFHHNPAIVNFDDPYQVQYFKLFNLADLNQENPVINRYLKDAARLLQDHGADALRVDAVKHCVWGWLYSLTNALYTHAPSFIFGEWFEGSTGDKLYGDSVKFANRSGMSILDYPLNSAIRAVFSGAVGFDAIDQTLEKEGADFARSLDLVTFVDNHDIPRLLSGKAGPNRLNEATAFVLTARGIPVIYYGDEQYLHNDTNGGGDPYDRNPMTVWDQTTVAYRLIQSLTHLRQTNAALAYGAMHKRWMNADVYVFEREFYGNVVLVAINRSDTASYPVTELKTDLPKGRYEDVLNGLAGGTGITVSGETERDRLVAEFALAPHSVAVWQKTAPPTRPEIGSIGPTIGQPGMRVTIGGEGFGAKRGSVWLVGPLSERSSVQTPAKVQSWSETSVDFWVPKVPPGAYRVELHRAPNRSAGRAGPPLTTGDAEASSAPRFTVLAGPLVPVTFTARSVPALGPGESAFLTGNVDELGRWSTRRDDAVGPLLGPGPPDYFLCVSVPAGAGLEFKFIKIAADESVTWESGANHMYPVPASGTGAVTVDWQK